MSSSIIISKQALFILVTLQKYGYKAYIVGGAVRDLLLKQNELIDYDFTTNATPEQILEVFPNAFYENDFGTVMLTENDLQEQMGDLAPGLQTSISEDEQTKTQSNNKRRIIDLSNASKIHESLTHQVTQSSSESTVQSINSFAPNYEITTFRSNEIYSNHRKPESVTWGTSLEEDTQRRDFTINALAIEVDSNRIHSFFDSIDMDCLIYLNSNDYILHDFHNGLADLEKGIIRTVGNPAQRFQEDALRMLRAIRFSVQLNLPVEENTFDQIAEHANLIEKISAERIRDELIKMMTSPFPADAIELLYDTFLLDRIIPELTEGMGVEQGGHHTSDVWHHSLDALRFCPSTDPIVRLATLLHDVGKPRTLALKNGEVTFYNHEVVGAHMVKKIAKRLAFSKKQTDRLFTLVRHHMFYYQPENTDASIRRFMRTVGLENVDDILDLREGDRLGSGAKRTSWRLEEMKQRMIEQLHQPMEVKDLAINGYDLMQQLDLKPGPKLGNILQQLFEAVLEDPELNTKEQLLRMAEEITSSNA